MTLYNVILNRFPMKFRYRNRITFLCER